jgi:hypothetical protein
MRVARRLRSRDALVRILASGPSGPIHADLEVTIGSVVSRGRTGEFLTVAVPATDPRRATVSFRIEPPGFRPYTSTVEVGAGETRVVTATLEASGTAPEPNPEPPP